MRVKMCNMIFAPSWFCVSSSKQEIHLRWGWAQLSNCGDETDTTLVWADPEEKIICWLWTSSLPPTDHKEDVKTSRTERLSLEGTEGTQGWRWKHSENSLFESIPVLKKKKNPAIFWKDAGEIPAGWYIKSLKYFAPQQTIEFVCVHMCVVLLSSVITWLWRI